MGTLLSRGDELMSLSVSDFGGNLLVLIHSIRYWPLACSIDSLLFWGMIHLFLMSPGLLSWKFVKFVQCLFCIHCDCMITVLTLYSILHLLICICWTNFAFQGWSPLKSWCAHFNVFLKSVCKYFENLCTSVFQRNRPVVF